MIELFADIPLEVKQQHEAAMDLIFNIFDIFQIDTFLKSYIATCQNEEEADFVNFLVQLRLEEYRNNSQQIES